MKMAPIFIRIYAFSSKGGACESFVASYETQRDARMTSLPSKLISPKRVHEKTDLSPREQRRRAEEGKFPQPCKLGVGRNGRIAYVEAEIDAWIAERIAERNAALAPAPATPPQAEVSDQPPPAVKRRGRPPGSKNKPKTTVTTVTSGAGQFELGIAAAPGD